MGSQAYTSKDNASLFIQKDGPNTPLQWLGCFEIDDITESEGAINLLFCIDEHGEYQVAGFTEDPPDLITFNMGTYFGKTKEVIETANCPFALYIALICDGKKDIFAKWDRVVTAQILKRTGRTLSGMQSRNEDTEMMVSFEVSANPRLIDSVRLRGYRQTVVETENLNSIVFCNDVKCNGRCGEKSDVCTGGMITTDAVGAGTANVLFTTDGLTWAAGAADPFTTDEHISDGICFTTGKTTTRHLVARGVTDAGNAAEIAYTDDAGTTWVTVDVGAVTGDFILGLYGTNRYNLWAVTNEGYIYESNDGGSTWTLRLAGTGDGLNAITWADALRGVAVGVDDSVWYTTDGGLSWDESATGSTQVLTNVAFNGLYWWITTNGGLLYYAIDHTGSWTNRAGFAGSGTGSIDAIDWANQYVGIIGQTIGGQGFALTTADGGESWERLTIGLALSINDAYMCGTDLAYVVGDSTSGTGYVARITPAAS